MELFLPGITCCKALHKLGCRDIIRDLKKTRNENPEADPDLDRNFIL